MDLIKAIKDSVKYSLKESTLYVDGKPLHDPNETPRARRKAMKGPARPLKPETLNILKDIEKKISEIPSPKKKDWSKMGTPPSYKVYKAGIDETLGTMDNIKKASKDAAIRSADPRTKPGDTPAWLKQAIKDKASKKVQKEELKLEEAVTVKKSTHSWGKMITVHHGSSHSFPLHPEHQEKIAKLKDGEHTSFTDETNSKVTAHREGDTVHLSLRGSNTKTPVAMSHFKEEIEQVDELSKATLGSYVKKASNDVALSGLDAGRNRAADGYYKIAKKKMSDRLKGIAKATDKLAKEEFDLDEAKRGRPRKDGTKPAGEDDSQEADKNIHTQLHKVISANKPVTFNNGKTHTITAAHAHKALHMLQNAKSSDRLAIQHSLSHSHDRFHETLKSGKAIVDAPRPKVSLGKMRAESSVYTADSGAMKPYVKLDGNNDLKVYQKRASKKLIKLENLHIEDEEILNKLYENLSIENRVIFNEMIVTEDGIESLVTFAFEQGL